MKWKCPYVLRNFVGRDTICLRKLQLSRFTIDGAKLMKQKIVARQYVPCHWDGRPSMPVSKNQCKRASKVPREPLMLKSIYLLEKQSNVRDRLSIVCKCMRTPPPPFTCCLPLYSMFVNKCSGHLLCQTLEALIILLNAIISMYKVLCRKNLRK